MTDLQIGGFAVIDLIYIPSSISFRTFKMKLGYSKGEMSQDLLEIVVDAEGEKLS